MKDSTKKYFDKAISVLNTMGISNENIVVTGSVALDILGVLPDYHIIHDFDCIVQVAPEKLGLFKLVCEMFKSDKCSSCIESNARMMEIDGVLINLWFNVKEEDVTVTYKGVGVKNMLSILKKKKSYMREKDCRDINEIAKKVLN